MRLTLLAVPLAVGVGFVVAAPSAADATPVPPSPVTVTFHDLTDSVTVTSDGDTGRVLGGCPQGEMCSLQILAPSGFTFDPDPSLSFGFALIGETGLTSGLISDEVVVAPQGGSAVQVFFASDSDPSTLGNCSSANPCQLVENGLVQLAGTITWMPLPPVGGAIDVISPNVIDTIQFQSDADATTPEPTTLLLLGTGLAATSRWFRARQRA